MTDEAPQGSLTEEEIHNIIKDRLEVRLYLIWRYWPDNNKFILDSNSSHKVNLKATVYFFRNYWFAYGQCVRCQNGIDDTWRHADWFNTDIDNKES